MQVISEKTSSMEVVKLSITLSKSRGGQSAKFV